MSGRTFSAGRKVLGWLTARSITVDAAARHAGIGRDKLSRQLNGLAELRVDALERLPVAIVREYVTDLAARVGLAVVPMGDADSDDARSHRVTAEAADVLRASAVNEADGYISAAEAADELREVRELERTLSARKAWLLRVIDQRGAAVVR